MMNEQPEGIVKDEPKHYGLECEGGHYQLTLQPMLREVPLFEFHSGVINLTEKSCGVLNVGGGPTPTTSCPVYRVGTVAARH